MPYIYNYNSGKVEIDGTELETVKVVFSNGDIDILFKVGDQLWRGLGRENTPYISLAAYPYNPQIKWYQVTLLQEGRVSEPISLWSQNIFEALHILENYVFTLTTEVGGSFTGFMSLHQIPERLLHVYDTVTWGYDDQHTYYQIKAWDYKPELKWFCAGWSMPAALPEMDPFWTMDLAEAHLFLVDELNTLSFDMDMRMPSFRKFTDVRQAFLNGEGEVKVAGFRGYDYWIQAWDKKPEGEGEEE